MSGRSNAIIGGLVFVVGIVVTVATASDGDDSVTVAYGAIIFGFVQLLVGVSQMMSDDGGSDHEPQTEPGYSVNHDIQLASNARHVSGEFTMNDYPASALRDGAEGRTVVGFTVDTSGEVRDVGLVESSGNSALDNAACNIIGKRFRFEPALKTDGNPVAQRRQQSIQWRLPDD